MANIVLRRSGPVGHVVFSNPDKFNAMTTQMWHELPAHIAALDADPDIRAIVLSGDGDEAFVPGADISQFATERSDAATERSDALAQERYGKSINDAYLAPSLAGKPVIAQIRGICMGGGL